MPYHKWVLQSHCLCEQDIGACAWRWGSRAGIRSGWDEPHQGPRGRLLRKSLWTQRQNQLSILLQPHHVWDWRGVLTQKTNDLVYHLIKIPDQSPSFPPCLRWWFQPTQRRWNSFRRSVWLSVSVLWTSTCRSPISSCPANRPSRASITGTSTEAHVWWLYNS